jgi:hypothetical protein
MRGVLPDGQESAGIRSAGYEGQRLTEPTIRVVGAFAGRQGSEVMELHNGSGLEKKTPADDDDLWPQGTVGR